MVSCARASGYLEDNFELVGNVDLGYLLPSEMLVIATGSQGEAGAALHRLAMDSHPDFSLSTGDHVIFSAKTIPGNDEDVARLVRAFESRGIKITHADQSDRLLHASGHPCADELTQMYQWIKPRVAIPVHGEKRHMVRNAELAEQAGVPVSLVGSNGDLFDLVQDKVVRGAAPVGRLWFDEEKGLLQPVRISR
jgi:ribonuclease J